MDIKPLRCHRPRPEHVSDLMSVPLSADALADAAHSGWLLKEPEDCLYLWQQASEGRRQIGVVCGIGLPEVEAALDGAVPESGAIGTGPSQTLHDDAARGTQTSPLALAYPDNYALDVLVSAAHAAEPIYDLEVPEGIRQRIWRVARPAALEAFEAAFTTVSGARPAFGGNEPLNEADEAALSGKTLMAFLVPESQAAGFSPLPEGLLIQRLL